MGEQRVLNLICVIAAVALFAFIAYNLFSAGSIISTDGLFFTVVPLVIALSFLAVPAQQMLTDRLEKRRIAMGEVVTPSGSAARIAAPTAGKPSRLPPRAAGPRRFGPKTEPAVAPQTTRPMARPGAARPVAAALAFGALFFFAAVGLPLGRGLTLLRVGDLFLRRSSDRLPEPVSPQHEARQSHCLPRTRVIQGSGPG